MNPLPPLVEPDSLHSLLEEPDLLVVDLSKVDIDQQYHVPGAVHLDYSRIIAARKPVVGLLPPPEQIAQVMSALGLSAEKTVVAYDDEGGGKAARLLWTLEAMGHPRLSLLNGGLHAWVNEGHPVAQGIEAAVPGSFTPRPNPAAVADAEYIMNRLGSPDLAFWDCRSEAEYTGAKRFAERGGHIPGAAHLEWTQAMDQNRNLRLKPKAELRATLESLGITPDKEVITYCQTHHRSAHSYWVLRTLGYPNIRGYHGSWSDWGNRADTPIE